MKVEMPIFANGNAGSFNAEEVGIVEEITGNKVHVTHDYSKLEQKLREYKDAPLVGMMGGDGTVLQTRTRVENIWTARPSYVLFPNGTGNNVQRAVGLKKGRKTIIKMSQALAEGNVRFTTLASIDLNGYKSFNVGFGVAPKILWHEYGHSAEAYLAEQRKLRQARTVEQEPVTKIGNHSTFRTIYEIYRGVNQPHSWEQYLFSQRLDGNIKVDGKDWKELGLPQPLGIYLASYEEANFNLGLLNPKPAPGAREVEGKLQIVAPYGRARDITRQLWKVVLGREMGKTLYAHVEKVELPDEVLGQACGEILRAKGFTARYDGTCNVMTL